jgi:hypothetical protein
LPPLAGDRLPKDTVVTDQKKDSAADELIVATTLLIFAAGATGAVLLRNWEIAELGLIAAIVAYVLVSLLAVIVRNLGRAEPPVPTVVDTSDCCRDPKHP